MKSITDYLSGRSLLDHLKTIDIIPYPTYC